MMRPGGSAGKQQQQNKKDERKQAVVIDEDEAAVCPKRFLAGKPLLAYSLDWLRLEKFDDIFICCRPSNAQAIRNYIQQFGLSQSGTHQLSIKVHASEKNNSIGDCLRDLDSKALIKTDFVLMKVGCCGNINLTGLLERHKRIRTDDKNAILTSLVRCVPTKQMINQAIDGSMYICDSANGRLLYYIKNDLNAARKNIELPTHLLLEYKSLRIHSNLTDTNLSICSQNVPLLYSDNFDFRTQSDLIIGIFDNEEVLGHTIYVHLLEDQYNQSVANPLGVMSQNLECFDGDFVYKRRQSYNTLRQLSSDSLVHCTKLSQSNYLESHAEDADDEEESDSSEEDMLLDEDDVIFFNEVLDSYTRAFVEHIENENLILEINSSKHAYNISIRDLHSIIIKALLELPYRVASRTPNTRTEYFEMEKIAMEKFKSVFKNYIQTPEARASVLETMESVTLSKSNKFLNEATLANLIYVLYNIDILDEASIGKWIAVFDKDDKLKCELRNHQGVKKLQDLCESDEEDDQDEEEEEDSD